MPKGITLTEREPEFIRGLFLLFREPLVVEDVQGWRILVLEAHKIVENVQTRSSVGQFYAFLVAKVGLCYQVRLFVEDEHPNCVSVPLAVTVLNGERNRIEQDVLAVSEHCTWKEVEERVVIIRNFFNKPDFNVARQIMDQSGYFQPYFIREVPKDYASNPEMYLRRYYRGDIIATPCGTFALHTAIYLGNGQVGHVSGHGGGKANGMARIGTLIGNFVSNESDRIWIVCLPLRIRPLEEIAKKAEKLAAEKFREGLFHILLRNCQHFVFLCATGVEYSFNI